MRELTIKEAQKLTSPNPVAVLTAERPDGSTNAMAVAWWNYASNSPATVTACLSKKGYSGELIKSTGHYTLSIVGESVKDAAFLCGTKSGRDVDKVQEFGLPLVKPEGFAVPAVEGSRVCFSCDLIGTADAGDHIIYIAQVTKICGDEEIDGMWAWNGYSKLAGAKIAE